MAENPSVTVSVFADIRALEAGMARAEQTVVRSSATMAQAVDRSDIGGRFNKAAGAFTRAAAGITEALRVVGSQTATTMQKIDGLVGGLSMVGGKFGMVAGASYQAGRALYDILADTERVESDRQREVEFARRAQIYSQETELLKLQLAILKETDVYRKAGLQAQLDGMRVTREKMTAPNAGLASDQFFALKRELVDAQSARTLKELREQENARRKSINEQLQDRRAEIDILKQADPYRKAELEYNLKMVQIAREIAELKARGASKAEIELAKLKEEVALQEKIQKQANISSVLGEGTTTTTIQTRLGGSFTFAENNIMRGIQQFAQQQVMLQTNLLNGMAEIIAIIKNRGYVIT